MTFEPVVRYTKNISVPVNEEMYRKIKNLAGIYKTDVQQMIRFTISNFLEEYQDEAEDNYSPQV